MRNLKKLSLVIIYGPVGAGKTTRADLLHDELSNTAHVGVDHIKRFISEFRDIPTHQEVSKKVINAMVIEYLKNSISVIVEQGMRADEIDVLKEIATNYHADFFVYRLNASREVLAERVEERTIKLNKPTISQKTIDSFYTTHIENDYPNTRVFDTGKVDAQEFLNVVLQDLKVL